MKITSEDIALYPAPGMSIPTTFKFSHSGKYFAYLKSQKVGDPQSLFIFDINLRTEILLADGSEFISAKESLEDDLRRQRLRQMLYGISRYEWMENDKILISATTGLYIFDTLTSPPRLLIDNSEYELLDPKVSPNGVWISFISKRELFLMDINEIVPRQITFDAMPGVTNGLADYIAQEEMQRISGYFWSPDSSQIAFTQVDTRHIPDHVISHIGSSENNNAKLETHKYPFAGADNPKIQLAVIDLEGNIKWLDISKYEYLPRFDWLENGDLIVQCQNREQTVLDLLHFTDDFLNHSIVLTEKSESWINIKDIYKPLSKGRFIWGSERSGFTHLYMYTLSDRSCYQITNGDWQVDSIVGINEESETIYFSSNKDSDIQRLVYAVKFDGNNITKLTGIEGTASAFYNASLKMFVTVESSHQIPPEIYLVDPKEDLKIDLHEILPFDDRLGQFSLIPPEIISLKSDSGEDLYGAVYKPDEAEFSPPYPAVVYVYGGPHSQLVNNSWALTASMRIQRLRQNGILVFILDNRGTARRGMKFESYLKNNMGDIEVRDQVSGVTYLIDNGLADPANVGIYGWSYGGYISLMCLAKAPDIFKLAISGAPVTSWEYYDTHYTERYMGHPNHNMEKFKESSVLKYVSNIRGKLLLIHGMLDENVHFRHTSVLLNELIAENKYHELLLFPDGRHMPTKITDRIYLEDRIFNFIKKNLD